MGRYININDNTSIRTEFTSGEDFTSITPQVNTYFVGVDPNTGQFQKLNPDGSIVSLEAGSVVPTTYNDLVNLIGSNGLVAGTYYSFNFTTIYDQPDFYVDGSVKPSGIIVTKTSTAKTLIVLATSNNTISNITYSPNYPNSKYKYDWTVNTTEVNGNPMEGRIIELIDSNNNRTDYDHEDVEFIRYLRYDKNTQLTGTITDFDCTTGAMVGSGTLFSSEVSAGDILYIESNPNFGFDFGVKVLSVTDDLNLVTEVDGSYSGLVFTSYNMPFYNSINSGIYDRYKEFYITQKQNTGYTEVLTFTNGNDNYVKDSLNANNPFYLSNNVFGNGFVGNEIGFYSVNNTISDSSSLNKIGSSFYNNVIGSSFVNNSIGNGFYSNTIASSFEENFIIGEFFQNITQGAFNNNIVNTFSNNIIGADFYNNNIGKNFNANTVGLTFYNNTIGDDCTGNSFGDNFGYGPNKNEGNNIGNLCQNNTFGTSTYGNVIGSVCMDNTFGANFINNIFGDNCRHNIIGDNCTSNVIGNYFGNGGSGTVNTIFDYFRYNKIGNFFGNDINFPGGTGNDGGNVINNYFQYNVTGDDFIFNAIDLNFEYNKIGDDFWFNIFDTSSKHNVIGNLFVGNVGEAGFPNPIGTNFTANKIGNFTPFNKIGSNFSRNITNNYFGNAGIGVENTIGDNCQDNNFGNYFGDDGTQIAGGNTIIDNFKLNTVETNTLYGVDFTLATHVYNDYNCTLFKRGDGTNRLSYIDSGDTLTIDNVNA